MLFRSPEVLGGNAPVSMPSLEFVSEPPQGVIGLPVGEMPHAWPSSQGEPAASGGDWEADLQVEAQRLLAEGRTDVWDVLTRRFETRLIQTALASTRGRRIEAAHKLGIGRNTITRKIQELGMD